MVDHPHCVPDDPQHVDVELSESERRKMWIQMAHRWHYTVCTVTIIVTVSVCLLVVIVGIMLTANLT